MKNGLFHRELGFPVGFWSKPSFTGPFRLQYSRHAMMAAATDRYNHHNRIVWPKQMTVIPDYVVEVLVEDGTPVKAVVRIPHDDTRDLVFVINQPDDNGNAFVRTVWINLKTDKHRTLDASKYTRP